jgi:hypothetical protein
MRPAALACLWVVAGSSAVFAEPPKTVHLNRLVLEELKKTQPDTYAEARRVMAAASELCIPGAAKVVEAREAQARKLPAATCAGVMLLTSYPPKREISFIIDDTKYVALVTMTAPPPELRGAVDPAH